MAGMQTGPEKTDERSAAFRNDVIRGLGAPRKHLDPKYFYDAAGSALFEDITRLPEYYITRTETRLMKRIAPEIGRVCCDTRAVIEFGSGSGKRSDILIDALPNLAVYVPMDVSPDLLEATRRVVNTAHPDIRVVPLIADFGAKLDLPDTVPVERLGYFPGSTIGNFNRRDAQAFLARAREALGRGARMLVGADLVKSQHVLDRAYNDSAGVTERFNKNILRRINGELDANFDIDAFAHQAFFVEERERVEMHLVSLADQKVALRDGPVFEFAEGETIHTENSYKFTLDGFAAIAGQAGWRVERQWTDEQRLFSVHLLCP